MFSTGVRPIVGRLIPSEPTAVCEPTVKKKSTIFRFWWGNFVLVPPILTISRVNGDRYTLYLVVRSAKAFFTWETAMNFEILCPSPLSLPVV